MRRWWKRPRESVPKTSFTLERRNALPRCRSPCRRRTSVVANELERLLTESEIDGSPSALPIESMVFECRGPGVFPVPVAQPAIAPAALPELPPLPAPETTADGLRIFRATLGGAPIWLYAPPSALEPGFPQRWSGCTEVSTTDPSAQVRRARPPPTVMASGAALGWRRPRGQPQSWRGSPRPAWV